MTVNINVVRASTSGLGECHFRYGVNGRWRQRRFSVSEMGESGIAGFSGASSRFELTLHGSDAIDISVDGLGVPAQTRTRDVGSNYSTSSVPGVHPRNVHQLLQSDPEFRMLPSPGGVHPWEVVESARDPGEAPPAHPIPGHNYTVDQIAAAVEEIAESTLGMENRTFRAFHASHRVADLFSASQTGRPGISSRTFVEQETPGGDGSPVFVTYTVMI